MSPRPITVLQATTCLSLVLNSPGHYKELVNLLIHKRIMGFPHLGLQFRLITAVLLTYGEQVSLRTAKTVEKTPEWNQKSVCSPFPQVTGSASLEGRPAHISSHKTSKAHLAQD